MVCAQCHSARTAIAGPYRPGADYFDFFIPALEYAQEPRPNASRDPVYWADGRPRRFSNDAFGLWQSACFLRGGATCTTCHTDPHLPNVDRNPQLAGEASEALCTSCHQDIAARRTEHTRHLPTSRGSQCIECHMPKTVVSIKASMRDHTISVPAPENTVKFDIPNACTECHRDKPASWAAAVMKSWWPDGRRQRLVAQAEAFTSARAGRATAVDALIGIADDPSYPPFVRANSVGYLGGFEQPRAWSAVIRAARSEEPVIRLAAIAALRGAAGSDANARAAILSALSDSRRAVRVAAALTVAERNGRDLDVAHFPQFRTAAREVVSWTEEHRDEPDLQRLQGVVQLLAGEINAAAEALATSLDHDPAATHTRFLLGLARLGQGRADEARELWRRIPRGDRYYESAQRQLRVLESTNAHPR
jgi:predicted CXXCH cytochrome family protein